MLVRVGTKISTIYVNDIYMIVSMTRGYAYTKIEYVSVRNVRIFRKTEYAYDTFRTQA